MKEKDTLALDFGTSNTYISKCPNDELMPSTIDLDSSDRPSIDTAILYRKDKPDLLGSVAINTYNELTPNQRQNARLATRFKPLIHTDQTARQDAQNFLTLILHEAQNQHISLNPQNREVYFGIPVESKKAYKETLKEIAQNAGFGTIKTIEEPLGALLYHLIQHDIAPSQAMKTVLVIDFGGGTCDLALLQNSNVTTAFGDWQLGGQLFDDLFYQILLEQNPHLESHLQTTGASYFVHWYWCRLLKESFSKAMKRDRQTPWSGSAGIYGNIKDLTWDQFLAKAQTYTPTPAFAQTIPELDGHPPINLIEKTATLLRKTQNHPIDNVILAGGSSLWPFMEDLILQIHPQTTIIRSDQPYGVIAKGISMLPTIRKRNLQTIEKLKISQHNFLKDEISQSLKAMQYHITTNATQKINKIIEEEILQPTLQNYKQTGGKASDLIDTIHQSLTDKETTFTKILHQEIAVETARLPGSILAKTDRWFKSNGVKSMPQAITLEELAPQIDQIFQNANISKTLTLNDIIDIADATTGVLLTLILANLAGGSGVALIAAGIPGLLAGAATGAIGYAFFRKKLRKTLNNIPIPPQLASLLMSKKSMDKITSRTRKSVEKQITASMDKFMDATQKDVQTKLSHVINAEIEGLSMVNQIGEP